MNLDSCNDYILLRLDGSSFKMKGSILTMSFLDCNGALIPYSYESWKDENPDSKDRNSTYRDSS